MTSAQQVAIPVALPKNVSEPRDSRNPALLELCLADHPELQERGAESRPAQPRLLEVLTFLHLGGLGPGSDNGAIISDIVQSLGVPRVSVQRQRNSMPIRKA